MESLEIEKRTKVSRACDYCKRRKFKCSGQVPCDLCSKKQMECTFSIVDRRTIRRKNKKRTVKAKSTASDEAPEAAAPLNTFVHKNFQSDGHIDKDTLKLLKQKSKIPVHFQPLTIFPLHKVDGKNDEEESEEASIKRDERKESSLSSEETDEKITTATGDSAVPKTVQGTRAKMSLKEKVAPSVDVKTRVSEQPLDRNRHRDDDKNHDHDHDHDDGGSDCSSQAFGTTAHLLAKTSVPDTVRSQRALYDSDGNLRYVGESSPLSFLFECRNLFKTLIGESAFTTDSDSFEVFDEPDEFSEIVQVALPNKETLSHILRFFSINVNMTCYILDPVAFEKNVITPIYTNYSACSIEQIAVINLVIALGLLYAETMKHPIIYQLQSPQMKSAAYFEYGIYLTKKYMNIGKLWITEAFYLAQFYYQAKQQRNNAWLMLGMSIRNAQALGLHRRYINESFKDPAYTRHRRKLFKSLYVCDRIASVLLGRPLVIDDYDWDDFSSEDIYEKDKNGKVIEDVHMKALFETCKLAKILGSAIKSFYLDGIIDPYKAEKLAIDVKIWSMNLPESLQIDKVIDYSQIDVAVGTTWGDGPTDVKIPLLLIHLSQLYAITLLARPFYMYVIFRDKRGKSILKRPKNRQEIAMCNFTKATVKASCLIIQFIECYTDYIKYMNQRVESYAIVHCVFMAALIVGLSVLCVELNQYHSSEGYNTPKLMGFLNSTKKIFCHFSLTNPMASRFLNIIEKMQQAIMTKFAFDVDGHPLKQQKAKPKAATSKNQAAATAASKSVENTDAKNVGSSKVKKESQTELEGEGDSNAPVKGADQSNSPYSSVGSAPTSTANTTTPNSGSAPTSTGEAEVYNFNKDYDHFIDTFGLLLPELQNNDFANIMQYSPSQDQERQFQPQQSQQSQQSHLQGSLHTQDVHNQQGQPYRDQAHGYHAYGALDSGYDNQQNSRRLYGYPPNYMNHQHYQTGHGGVGGAGVGGVGVGSSGLPSTSYPDSNLRTSSFNTANATENGNNNNGRKRSRDQLDDFMYSVGLNDLLYDAKI
ncbi:uncharacterized protein LODBEIA_P50200 [Lodderomyces beijingensis]|uniref:Zn(2)-C6 fungal-type domain-containing protein n=1 Tax=Lodderomyces beijingensis TaxID=1775926 RepID=A0ABP0ZRK8_9ASCO